MRDIAQQVGQMAKHGKPLVVATIVAASGSSPMPPGTAMVVDASGAVLGSISGGCVEGAVHEAAMRVLEGEDPNVQTYGYSDDDAFAVGLTCGGSLEVLVSRAENTQLQAWAHSVAVGTPVALVTVVDGSAPLGRTLLIGASSVQGSLGDLRLDAAVTDDTRDLFGTELTVRLRYGPDGSSAGDDVEVLVQVFMPPPRMIVFGATDFARAVSDIGVFLGYRVTVCDARATFATPRRFPRAHEVVCDWPHRYLESTAVDERTVLCVLTHDPKFDVPLLELALRRPVRYIGVMGSRRTHDDRTERLRQVGVSSEALARLHSPIGLDLGARTAQETAVSIAAEIVQTRWGGSGRPLGATVGSIHRPVGRPLSDAVPIRSTSSDPAGSLF